MTKQQLNSIALKILNLEHACEKGECVSENLAKMDLIMDGLSEKDLFHLAEILEDKTCQNKKFLI